jgi:DNA-binding SARP family transcriptional activator
MNGAVMAGDSGLRIGLLGPLAGTRDGAVVRLPRGRPGVLLAVLAMSAGRPVGVSRLTELIWDDEQPERARASLQTLVARVRGLVPGVVVHAGEGYLLDVAPDDVDLWQFRRLVRAAGQAGSPVATLGLLDQALGLWRGEPLASLRSSALDRDVIPGLIDEYLSAVQQHADLDLDAGRYDQVSAELRGLTGRHPLREPLWGRLMRALAGAGRPAEAIRAYHRAREILAAELGVDPSPDLQDLYQRLLHADQRASAAGGPPGGPRPGLRVPRQRAQADDSDRPDGHHRESGATRDAGAARAVPHRLPADTRVFTGRQPELTRLLELAGTADGSHRPGTVVISAIDGMAGIGKTALAVHAAHRLASQFGDGQLFIDLHGYTQGYPPRTPGQALETFLRTLGVPPQQIPEDTEERAALYRERLAGTRTLIVLDNAAGEAQVRPLIPGGTGCLVLVTSRRKLKSLDDAHALALDVLPEPDAITLLRTAAGPGRATADDPAVAAIVGLCGHIPLALRMAAALMRNRPAWNPEYLADKLRAARTRLDALFDGDRGLSVLFDLSSQILNGDQRRLYCYLGRTPGPEIDACAAAALLDTDAAAAERLLQQLVDHNLVLEPSAGRYRMHDLIRAHARALASPDPAPGEAALERLLDYYQHTARRADDRIARYARPGPPGPAPAQAPALPDAHAARTWLRAERANLTACLQYAIQASRDERTVALSVGLAGLLRTDGPWPQAMAAQTAAAAAARRLGDRPAQARALTELGDLRRLTGDYPAADHSLQTALQLWRDASDKNGQAHALTELGTLRRVCGDHRAADHSLQTALELWREAGDKNGQARALTELGSVQYSSGDVQGAKRRLREALQLYREAGDKAGQARALTELAEMQMLTGAYEGAIQNGEAALAMSDELGDRLGQANALSLLGRMRRLTGDYEDAARHQKAAMDVYRELGDRLGEANARMLLAEVRSLTGDYEGAIRDLEQSIGTYRDLGNRGNQACALNYYAAAISATGDLTRAIAIYRDALRLAREVKQPDDEAAALKGLGENHTREGNVQHGATCLHQALKIYRRLGMPAAEQVTARLAEIGSLE